MSRDLCLMSVDNTPIPRKDLLELLAQQTGSECAIENGKQLFEDGDLTAGDLVYSWADRSASESIRRSIVTGKGFLEFAESTSVCAVHILDCDGSDDSTSELEKYAAYFGHADVDAYVNCNRNSRLQYEVGGYGGPVNPMLILQYDIARVIAHLRGGLLMDSGSEKQVMVGKETWAPPSSEFMRSEWSEEYATKLFLNPDGTPVKGADALIKEAVSSESLRRYESTALKKFWEIQRRGTLVTTTTGASGKPGTTTLEQFSTEQDAIRACAKLVKDHTGAGYKHKKQKK